jgi:hypothetical protein
MLRSKVLLIACIAAISMFLVATVVASRDGTKDEPIKHSYDEIVLDSNSNGGSIPYLINYQGYLKDKAGNPITNTLQMIFSIWSEPIRGFRVWSEIQPSVSVANGQFNVLLGSVTPIPSDAFDEPSRWLEIEIEEETLSPRQQIASVGYAFTSGTLGGGQVCVDNAGNVGIGTKKPSEKLDVAGNIHATGVIKSGNTITIDGNNDSITASSGTIDFGDENLITTGSIGIGDPQNIQCPFPVFAVDVCMDSGNASYPPFYVPGLATVAVRDPTCSLGAGMGIYNSDPDPQINYRSAGLGAAFEDGLNPRKLLSLMVTSVDSYGVLRLEELDGVLELRNPGIATLRLAATSSDIPAPVLWTDGDIIGMKANEFHVYNDNLDPRIIVDSIGDVGIGTNNPVSKLTVCATEAQTNPLRVFDNQGDTCLHVWNNEGVSVGSGTAQPPTEGLYVKGDVGIGTNNPVSKLTVCATEAQTNPLRVFDNQGDTCLHVWNNEGVSVGTGITPPPTEGLYVKGNLQVGGTIIPVVATSQGARALYTEESAGVWFTDYGFGRLQKGRVVIKIDPIFVETVNLEEPYHVFVQLNELNCEGVAVVNKTTSSFEVMELREGRSNAEFSYRIVAKRRGYEQTRLEHVPEADKDPILYSEK